MPNPGIIDADLIAACKAVIDAEFGAIPPGLNNGQIDGYRMKLARCIAKAAQYVRDNAIVNPGQTVDPAGLADPQGGAITGLGTVNSNGTLS
jgi:hypothetical protein